MKDKSRHLKHYFETKQFCVIVRNLPEFKSKDELMLKSQLWAHIDKILQEQNFTQEVYNIEFAQSNYSNLKVIQKILKMK
mmetsp:Transcript_29381/g.44383  ORF Transcript_29381/g.44383 Transcript_29381/m.44383 type:complete len:80 (+) Transcript_29381:1099-1338(+)